LNKTTHFIKMLKRWIQNKWNWRYYSYLQYSWRRKM